MIAISFLVSSPLAAGRAAPRAANGEGDLFALPGDATALDETVGEGRQEDAAVGTILPSPGRELDPWIAALVTPGAAPPPPASPEPTASPGPAATTSATPLVDPLPAPAGASTMVAVVRQADEWTASAPMIDPPQPRPIGPAASGDEPMKAAPPASSPGVARTDAAVAARSRPISNRNGSDDGSALPALDDSTIVGAVAVAGSPTRPAAAIDRDPTRPPSTAAVAPRRRDREPAQAAADAASASPSPPADDMTDASAPPTIADGDVAGAIRIARPTRAVDGSPTSSDGTVADAPAPPPSSADDPARASRQNGAPAAIAQATAPAAPSSPLGRIGPVPTGAAPVSSAFSRPAAAAFQPAAVLGGNATTMTMPRGWRFRPAAPPAAAPISTAEASPPAPAPASSRIAAPALETGSARPAGETVVEAAARPSAPPQPLAASDDAVAPTDSRQSALASDVGRVPQTPLADRPAATTIVVASAPAAIVFGAARFAAGRERIDEAPPAAAALAAQAAPVAAQSAATGLAPAAAPLDMRHERWPHAMVERIEMIRDAADAVDTRIRLVPDALGPVDVAVTREGDTLHVHFAAASAETRTLIQDSQPRLVEAAESRGLRLGQTSVGADSAGQQPPQQRRPSASDTPRAPVSTSPASGSADADDRRLA